MSSSNSRLIGFTLLELMMVIALLFIALGLAVPYGLRFFNVQRLNSASRDVLEILRLAQSQALNQNFDSDFGVFIEENNFIFFKGSSYSKRDTSYDQIFHLSKQVSIEGLTEVVFERLSGLPKQTGEINFSSGERVNVIRINDQGLISLDLNMAIGTP